MSDHRRRSSVFIVEANEEFNPQRPWEIPAEFTRGELFAKNLFLDQAAAFARVWNKRAIQQGVPDRRWAIVLKGGRS